MEHWGRGERVLYGARLAFGLGLVLGAVELLRLTATSVLPLGLVELALTGLIASSLVGALGALFAVLCAPVHTLRVDAPAYRNVAAQFGGAAALLAAFYLGPLAAELWAAGRAVPALAFAAMPVGAWGVVALNARFWLARVELGRAPPVGWLPLCAGAAAVIVLASSVGYSQRNTGGGQALGGDPNVLLVTVDGLRADQLGELPAVAALGARGGVFTHAVSPVTASLPAHASLLTGLHPLRHLAATDHLPLTTAVRSIAEVFAEEGFATGAFVSSVAVGAHSGLSQGFLTYDDAVGPLPGAVGALRVVEVLAALIGAPELLGVRRPAAEAAAAMVDWVHAHEAHPWFGWLHLDAPLDGSRSAPLADVDAAVGALLAAIEADGAAERTLVVVVGSFGAAPPPEGPRSAPFGLSEALVRVPLVVYAPGRGLAPVEVGAQVRLMDVPQTALEYAGLDVLKESEGVELLGYLAGARSAPMWCSLLGRSPDGWLVGMKNRGVKYVRDVVTDDEVLYDLDNDPLERDNLAMSQEKTVAQARSLLASDVGSLSRLAALPEVGPLVATRLRALAQR